MLGGGQFGGVYVGMWNGSKGRSEVAIKMLNQSSVQPDARIKFLQEAAIMAQFRHPNIIELYGIVTDGESVSSYLGCYIILFNFQCPGDVGAGIGS